MNFLLFLLIILSFYTFDFQKIFFLSFIFGLLLDFIFGNFLGTTSLLLLIICFLVYLYRRKFSSSHLLFQLVFILFINTLLTLVNKQSLSVKNTLFILFLSLLILPILNTIKGKNTDLELEVK